MDTTLLFSRFDRIGVLGEPGHSHIRLHREGPCIILRTDERHVRMRQIIVRLAAIGIVLAGMTLVPVSHWGVALVIAGFATFALVPRFIRVADLLRIDAGTGKIVVVQPAASPADPIAIEHVRRIEGVYKIQGWDGDSTIYAVQSGGTRTPILVFPGTNEALARYICRLLGYLLDRPATYAGAFDDVAVCYRPEDTVPVHAP